MSQYLFSQFKSDEFESLQRELSKVFYISQETLQGFYEVMRKEFKIEGYPPERTLPRSIFHSDDEEFQKRYHEALVIGIDIPSILERNDDNSNKKTIVIVGQDPLRKSDERVEEIRIATPYALHLKSCREEHRSTRLYFDLIKILLDEGYRVYLTDIFKIWVSQPDKDKGIKLSKQDRDRFIQVLKAELRIFEPLAIITWGGKASSKVRNMGLEAKHLAFTHRSGAACGTWRKILNKPVTRENKIDFWKQKVFSELAEL
ncbi:uracil-DNA glycosylase [Nostoc sp. FACHB-110]|uniref:uracil-DNA glycosylase n=1 Tax=Nostoc sp. FACHB-110 TaxID=2692834 RepID=UPI00168650D7|nr:uracil-DNA glycosylase [Nostoc sp. FACHB-110]MBD2435336.1 uracil-DNA glycosylase [Nostoc sp. FACHB-110]